MDGKWRLDAVRQLGVFLPLFWCGAALAEPGKEQVFPPVEQASFHQLVFADEDLAILNNRYPPGGDSGFHTHYRDLFYVVIQPAESRGQGIGKPMTAAPKVEVGTAGFSAVGDQPRTHRVINGDSVDFQIIVVELRRPSPLGKVVSARESEKQYVQLFDNDRLRAWRLILEPGHSVSSISQRGKGVRIVVRGGLLSSITPGLSEQILFLKPGDFSIQPVGFSRALANRGHQTIELVELEFK